MDKIYKEDFGEISQCSEKSGQYDIFLPKELVRSTLLGRYVLTRSCGMAKNSSGSRGTGQIIFFSMFCVSCTVGNAQTFRLEKQLSMGMKRRNVPYTFPWFPTTFHTDICSF